MGKRAANRPVAVNLIVRGTLVAVALCATSLVGGCGGGGSPSSPTQPTNDGHITVTDLKWLGDSRIGVNCVKGTIRNTGSVTIDRHLYMTSVFYDSAGRLDSNETVVDRPFGPGERRAFLIHTSDIAPGWTYFRLELVLDLPGSSEVVDCTGCDSRDWEGGGNQLTEVNCVL